MPSSTTVLTLVARYRRSGGCLRCEETSARRGLANGDVPTALLERAADGRVVSLKGLGAIWIPVFQFQRPGWVLKPAVRDVLKELRGVFDPHEMATWFASSNDWLGHRRPADVLDADRAALLSAARADRFVAVG